LVKAKVFIKVEDLKLGTSLLEVRVRGPPEGISLDLGHIGVGPNPIPKG